MPSFALQHLVENAIRHGIARRTGAGVVEVRARREGDVLELSVADDGAGISERLDAAARPRRVHDARAFARLYGDRATLDIGPRAGGGTLARLRVPYREIEGNSDDGER